jgi:hypothetical protein
MATKSTIWPDFRGPVMAWTMPLNSKADINELYKPTWYEDPIRMNLPRALAE